MTVWSMQMRQWTSGLLSVANFLMHLARDRSGGVAIMFALILTVVIGTAGLAIDFGRLVNVRTKVQNSLDAAALAAAIAPDNASAETIFKNFLQSNAIDSNLAALDRQVGSSDVNVTATYAGQLPMTLAQVIGIKQLPVTATSSATSPKQLSAFTITPEAGYGWFPKVVNFIVLRPDGTREVVATITYVPTDISALNGRGIGTLTVTPSPSVTIDNYVKFWAEMTVQDITNNLTTIISTDDPNYAYHLFIDGVQMEQGKTVALDHLMPCGKKAEFAWEDGGGFQIQDIFFDISSSCDAINKDMVRLTR